MKKLIYAFFIFLFCSTAFAGGSKADFLKTGFRGFVCTTMDSSGNLLYHDTGNTVSYLGESDFRLMAAKGANLLRVFVDTIYPVATPTTFANVATAQKTTLENLLTWGYKYGFNVVVVLEPMDSNGVVEVPAPYWGANTATAAPNLAAVWSDLVTTIHAYPAIEGYDLLNEPMQTTTSQTDLEAMFNPLVAAIRGVDATTPIIVESTERGYPHDLYNFTSTFMNSDSNLVYSFHYYSPWPYASQGINNPTYTPTSYPNGTTTTYTTQLADLNTAILFGNGSRNHISAAVPVYVGEYGAVRWAPGSLQYISDLKSIWEAQGWSWTFFSWRPSYDGWNYELGDTSYTPNAHTGVPQPSSSSMMQIQNSLSGSALWPASPCGYKYTAASKACN